MTTWDIQTVRSQFPALAASDQILFDNAGGSQTLGSVIDAISDYLQNTNVQLGASYRIGKLATERYAAGCAAGARYVNADISEIVFGPSTTQLFRNVSFALLDSFAEGDEIVVSAVDHEANIAPWVDLAARGKLVLKWWKPDPVLTSKAIDVPLTPSTLAPLLTPRTRLISLTHASNILGTVTDVKAISDLVRAGPSPDALVVVDAVGYAPHRPLDVKELGVDVYAFSWYKVFGPHVAMLYASSRAREAMGSLGHFFKKGVTLEEKIGLAGASYELVSSIPAVTSYLSPSPSSSSWPAMIRHEHALQSILLAYLVSRADVTVYGAAGPEEKKKERVSTISFRVRGYRSREIVETIEEEESGGKKQSFGFRWGAFYSERLVKEILGLGDDGVARVSLAHYNTGEF
ncbi:aminotransferase class-V [Xylariaceae sp. FL0594]|nr:aminotransferase class-V [Xylariaceae sp. FL0594]